MKDLPHHMKKLNRRVIRSERRMEHDEELFDSRPLISESERPYSQLRKQKKARMRKERREHVPSGLTPEERNRLMKKRVPVFDRLSSRPKIAKAAKKKTHRF